MQRWYKVMEKYGKMVGPSRGQFARHSSLLKKLDERSKGNLAYPALLGLVNHLLYSYHLGCVLQAIPARHLTWKVCRALQAKATAKIEQLSQAYS